MPDIGFIRLPPRLCYYNIIENSKRSRLVILMLYIEMPEVFNLLH